MVPEVDGDVSPADALVQVHVHGSLAQNGGRFAECFGLLECVGAFDHLAFARHRRPLLSCMPPPGGKLKITVVRIHLSFTIALNHGDTVELAADGGLTDAMHFAVNVQKRCYFTPQLCRTFERLDIGGKRNAGPVLPKRALVFGAVGRGMQDRDDVEKRHFVRRTDRSEEFCCLRGNIWMRLSIPEKVACLMQQEWKEIRESVPQIVRYD